MKWPGEIWDDVFSGIWRRLHVFGSKPRARERLADSSPPFSVTLPLTASETFPFDPRIAALTAALNADKGMRARAVHLVIVEQTLLQGVAGGLSAIPAPVLEQAIAQLRSLSLFLSSLDLQRLCQSMRLTLKTQESIANHQQGLGTLANRVPNHPPESRATTREVEAGCSPRRSPQPPQPHPSERSSSDDDDDFPDTQAFDDDREE
jgi:hypothetical protein